jgi:phosphopantothenoylcysteine decarboxylase/phosphopantothenate--cysteine ligase
MRQAVLQELPQSRIVLMAAAVGDFKPARYSSEKIKKEDMPDKIELASTPDILKEIAEQKNERIVVGFALQSRLDVDSARKKLADKKLDLIVVNTTEYIGADKNQVVLVTEKQQEELPLMYKEEVARMIMDRVVELFRKRNK